MTTQRMSLVWPAILTITVLLLTTVADAQEGADNPPRERLRVGLVLGGGGARGAAHIGVLRELERLRVPIDAIAGTSMGAVVGGLYAAGYTPDELAELVTGIDWAAVLADTPRRDDLNYRRKEDDAQFPIRFELGIRDGELRMPMGLVQGHRLGLLLHQLTLPVANVEDFDSLPIPFRAVAADLTNASRVVIDHGDLAAAMRASMSVPGVFAPAEIDGRMLADGGLVDNLPIDVIREMNVDVIIAVDAEFPLYAPEELDSALRITEQMLTILIRKETLRQIATLRDGDILVRPDIGTFASTDFGAVRELLEPGSEATRANGGRLSELALDAEEYAEWSARRRIREHEGFEIGFVRVQHDGTLEQGTLAARIKAEPGGPVSAKLFEADADRLYGLGLFEKVDYRVVDQGDDVGVEYRAKTKSWGSNNLLFGLSLEDDLDGATAFNVTARLNRVGMNDHGGEWRNDLQIGTAPMIFSEFYQPLGAGSSWFVAPHLELSRSSLNSFEMDDQVAQFRVGKAEGSLDFGRQIGYSGELRVGAYRGSGQSWVKIGAPSETSGEFETGGLFAALNMDTLDDAHFPTRGMRGTLRWTASRTDYGADAEFNSLEFSAEKNWTRGRATLQAAAGYATTNDSTGAVQELFPLGGFLRLSGLESGALNGPHSALLRLVYRQRVGSSVGGIFDVPVYMGASLETGNVWQQRSAIGIDSALMAGSVFVGLDTYVGPVFIAAGFAEGGQTNFYLSVGAPPR